MKKISSLLLVLIGCAGAAFTQNVALQSLLVPDSLSRDASVMKLSESVVFEVTDIDRAYIRTKKTVIVYNKNGESELEFAAYTSKFRALDDVELKLFDANGKLIRKIKKKDLTFFAYGEGLVDDGKVHYVDLSQPKYPVTLESDVSYVYKGTLFYPTFMVQSFGEGVLNSEYTAKIPNELGLRFRTSNLNINPTITEEGKYKIYNWKVSNLSPKHYEQGSFAINEYSMISLAPNKFKLDSYEGNMSTWKEFGYWYTSLAKDGISLSPAKQEFFRNLVKNASTPKEKASIIYQYLQKNFRYVSIQLGIGGYKPFPAEFTDSKKYGDCKGLSNFMQAALAVVGVKSYQALIYRGKNNLYTKTEFPASDFNHVILMVPNEKDSIWLECTSNTLDFGTLDQSTLDRKALLITEDGGQLVNTPSSTAELNQYQTRASVTISEDGSALTESMINCKGEYKLELYELKNEKRDDLKEYLVHHLKLKQPDDFDMKFTGSGEEFHSELKMEIEKLPEFKAGSKMFIAPRLHKLWTSALPSIDKRTTDFYISHPLSKGDTTYYILPAGYTHDALPKPKKLECSLGTYVTNYWVDEKLNAIVTTAKLVVKSNRIPAAEFLRVKEFFDQVLMDDSERIVIKKS